MASLSALGQHWDNECPQKGKGKGKDKGKSSPTQGQFGKAKGKSKGPYNPAMQQYPSSSYGNQQNKGFSKGSSYGKAQTNMCFGGSYVGNVTY